MLSSESGYASLCNLRQLVKILFEVIFFNLCTFENHPRQIPQKVELKKKKVELNDTWRENGAFYFSVPDSNTG